MSQKALIFIPAAVRTQSDKEFASDISKTLNLFTQTLIHGDKIAGA
jgi:hypothetical protein